MGEPTSETPAPVRKPRGKQKKVRVKQTREWAQLNELKAMWVVQLLHDQIWLYGHSPKINKIVCEHFKCTKNTAEKAVTRAYVMFRESIEKWKPDIGAWLIEIHRKTIEKGFKEDGRLITPAASAMAKLTGAEMAEKVHITGQTTVTHDERNLLAALRFTNAQRQAEIDRITKELAEGDISPPPEITEPVDELSTSGDNEPTDDDDDD